MTANRRLTQGMVLLEVMMALTLFAVVSLGLIVALNESMGVAGARNQTDAAVRGMENQLTILRNASLVPTDKDLPSDGSGMTYHVKIAPESMLDEKKQPVLGMYRATVSVQWKSDGGTEEREVSELLYQP